MMANRNVEMNIRVDSAYRVSMPAFPCRTMPKNIMRLGGIQTCSQ